MSSVPVVPKALSSSRHCPMYLRRFNMAEEGAPACHIKPLANTRQSSCNLGGRSWGEHRGFWGERGGSYWSGETHWGAKLQLQLCIKSCIKPAVNLVIYIKYAQRALFDFHQGNDLNQVHYPDKSKRAMLSILDPADQVHSWVQFEPQPFPWSELATEADTLI